jgi:predicted Zn finger-like uncharacterized protein
MKVSCPSCQSTLSIDDKKIPATGARIKCPTCQNIFPIKPAAAAVPLPAPKHVKEDWEDQPTRAIPLPAATAAAMASTTTMTPAPTIPLPGASKQDWEDQPTRAVPLPSPKDWDSEPKTIPGARTAVAPPSNARTSSSAVVPLPGISASRPSSTQLADEPTRLEPSPGFDLERDVPPAPPHASASIPLPGAAEPVQARASIPLPGAASPVAPPRDAIPLPGAATFDDVAPPAPRTSIPLPGAAAPVASAPRGTIPDRKSVV